MFRQLVDPFGDRPWPRWSRPCPYWYCWWRRQSASLAVLVPFALLLMLDGRRGLRDVWSVALTAGLTFGAGQFLCSSVFTCRLNDLTAGVFSTLAVVVLLLVWQPTQVSVPITVGSGDSVVVERDSLRDIVTSFLPYGLLTVLFDLTSINGPVQRFAAASECRSTGRA